MRDFDELIEVVRSLRDPVDGCPWDKKQTRKSLIPNFIEELYEAVEAIENGDIANLQEELGDILLHILFQTQIGDEKGEFTIKDVIRQIKEKLIRRHPHVFGEHKAANAYDAKLSWEAVKREEKKDRKSILDGIPSQMPSLIIASRMQEKADAAGFSWDSVETILSKIKEEFAELEEAVKEQDRAHTQEEFGDLLFALVSYANYFKLDPESSLRDACAKFRRRFGHIEDHFKASKKVFADASIEEMEALWQDAKKKGK